jgi:peptidoglycan-associated lipoprotein
MKKLIIATSIGLALTLSANNNVIAATNQADMNQTDNTASEIKSEAQKIDLIGFGSGATAGAIVGGPLGAMIGGIFGLMIADDVNSDATLDRTHNKLVQTESSLNQAQYSLEQQQQSLVALQSELQTFQERQMVQLVSYEQQSNDSWLNDLTHFETNLQFKTASFSVDDTYKAQLNSLANILNSYPQLAIKVTGFADQRGDSDYNQQLSQQRADAVAQYLSGQNVNNKQITIIGAGEEVRQGQQASLASAGVSSNQPLSASGVATSPALNTEDLFFSRRVNISLMTPKEQMTAGN